MPDESDARHFIDRLLVQAGWDVNDPSQIRVEVHEVDGRADYVLYDTDGNALCVIEAKPVSIDPYSAKEQALPYAKRLGAPFIFLSNGEVTYFWDYLREDARIVAGLFSRRDLERLRLFHRDQQPLAEVPVPDHYSRRGQVRTVRPYQQEAMRAIDHGIELGKRRFLVQLPTGTGKTDLVCLYLKRLIQAKRAERILFLVDRDTLAQQAVEALKDVLSDQGGYSAYWLRAGEAKQEQQITVCLLQTMIGRYYEFTSGEFDIIITDECHRSIYGSWQVALSHFDAIQIGLTATPSEYIDKNTYHFFGCKDQQADFSYALKTAFDEQYLIPYRFSASITKLIKEGMELDAERLEPSEFERKWTNEQTNRMMMEEFYDEAARVCKDIAPGQETLPGKSIIYAITKAHATRLARYLNEIHRDRTGDSRSDFAAVITSDIPDASSLIRRFKREDYPQVAVSVGMLDTGFDCPEVLHIVMCRMIRSPILYQQIRGRGTRRADNIGKQVFIIYDFFDNHVYFNDSDTDVYSGGGSGGKAPTGQRPKPIPVPLIEANRDDEWIYRGRWIEFPDGELVDRRDFVSNWENVIRSQADDALVQKVRNGEPLSEAELDALAQRLNSPGHYFNEDNLRKAYRQPDGSLIDFIRQALGQANPQRPEERMQQNFQAWLVAQHLTPEQAQYLTLLKNRFIANRRAAVEDLFRPPLSMLNAGARGIQLFGEDGLRAKIQNLHEQVFEAEAV